MNENAKIQDLKVAHDIILKSNNLYPPNRFDELRNLRGSDHFIVKIDDSGTAQIIDMNKRKDAPPMQGKNGMFVPPHAQDNAARMWMASFIKGDAVNEKQFKESYDGRKFLFIISSVKGTTDKTYLISYMPELEDNSIFYTFLGIGVLFIAIGFIAAKIVANYLAKPLQELEAHTLRIAKKDWKEPIQVKSDDEIGRLAAAMNTMQKELKRADEEEKMFLQSISHDLKTPVMVIMSHAEAIKDGVYIDSIEKTAEIIRDEAINLEKKIKQLLYLNTLDYVMENNSESTEIHLNDLLQHMINRFEVVNSKIDWNLDMGKITVTGNIDKLKVAIENILDNGLRYAESTISISLRREENYAILEIYNDGPQIDKIHIDHIFDHFYKDKTGNFGLGLAISKKIIDFYKGEIKAVNREKGVSFIIKYPI